MNGRVVVLAGAVCAAAIVPTASARSDLPSGVAARAGVTYGAFDAQGGHVWLKLRKDRKAFLSHEVEWYANCSDGDRFYSETFLGSEHGRAMPVRNRRFAASAVDSYGNEDVGIREEYRVSGRVTAAAIKGQFTVNVTGTFADGTGFTCKAGPVRFNAVN
jgi:hypothetical protein